MDRKDIVRKLLEAGLMVSPHELDRLHEDNIDDFIARKKGRAPEEKSERKEHGEPGKDAAEDEPAAKEAQAKSETEKPVLGISIISHEPKRMGAKDFTELYRRMFQQLRSLLAKKVDAVSINKTKNVFSSVSIIGMVQSRTERGYIVEDETGSMEVVTDQTMDEDDIVGISGMVREGRLFAGEIEYPDIPFNREIGKLDATVFVGKSMPSNVEADAFLVSGKAEGKAIAVRNPSSITLSRGQEKATALFYRPEPGTPLHHAGAWLKRRHLPSSWKGVRSAGSCLVLDPAPDVIWVDVDEKGSSLHKGVLVVSPGASGALVNLETKEVEFL